MSKYMTLDAARRYNLGKWDEVTDYQGRYYGPNGNDLGTIPISIAELTDPDQPHGEDTVGWMVAETPDEDTIQHAVYETKEEAREAALALAAELDETPDVDDVIQAIAKTGYFDDPDLIPLIVREATRYSQGYLLITSDICEPIGTRWTTNGYLECDYLTLDATYSTRAQAAEALLAAVRGVSTQDDDR